MKVNATNQKEETKIEIAGTAYSMKMKLQREMGGKCAWCEWRRDLQFDCIQPRGSEHHGLGGRARLLWYRREFVAGNLQLLCIRCHTVKSLNERKLRSGRFADQRVLPGQVPADFKAWCEKMEAEIFDRVSQVKPGTPVHAGIVPTGGNEAGEEHCPAPISSAKKSSESGGPLT